MSAPDLNMTTLRALLTDRGVKKPHARWELSETSMMGLLVAVQTRAINILNPFESPIPSFHDPEGEQAALTLIDHLNRRRADAVHAVERRSHRRGRWIGMIFSLDKAIADAEAMLLLLRPVRQWPTPVGWHDHAPGLADLFVRFYCESNPAMPPPGLSDAGPVAGFVAAIIPYVTAETPSVNAVRKRLSETGWRPSTD